MKRRVILDFGFWILNWHGYLGSLSGLSSFVSWRLIFQKDTGGSRSRRRRSWRLRTRKHRSWLTAEDAKNAELFYGTQTRPPREALRAGEHRLFSFSHTETPENAEKLFKSAFDLFVKIFHGRYRTIDTGCWVMGIWYLVMGTGQERSLLSVDRCPNTAPPLELL